MDRDAKKPRGVDRFSGATSTDKSLFGRGYSRRPVHLALQTSHDVLVSYCSHGTRLGQASYSAPPTYGSYCGYFGC